MHHRGPRGPECDAAWGIRLLRTALSLCKMESKSWAKPEALASTAFSRQPLSRPRVRTTRLREKVSGTSRLADLRSMGRSRRKLERQHRNVVVLTELLRCVGYLTCIVRAGQQLSNAREAE